MNEKEYRNHPAVSYSGLKIIAQKTMRHYQHEIIEGNKKITSAMEFGRAAHLLFLEPEKFNDMYKVAPYCNLTSIKGVTSYLEWLANAVDKPYNPDCKIQELRGQIADLKQCANFEIIAEDDLQIIQTMQSELQSSATYNVLIKSGKVEQSFFGNIASVDVKGRADFISDFNGGVIIDIKTCQLADERAFLRDAYKYYYHMQAWIYQELVRQETGVTMPFIFIAIEKEAPHCVNFIQLPDDMIELGRVQALIALETYELSQTSGLYKGYSDTIQTPALPAYIYKELEQLIGE